MNDIHKRWWLYALRLENDKWYVGITSKTPERRYEEHLYKRGANWTRANKPLSIELVEDLGVVSIDHALKYENQITRSLMKERGLNNVRGGDLTDVEEYTVRFGWILDKEMWDVIVYVILMNLIIIRLIMDRYDWNMTIFISLILIVVATVLVIHNREKKNDKR